MYSRSNRSQLILGLLLIVLGIWFFAQRAVPSFADFTDSFMGFPYNLMWIGAALLVFGMFMGNPGMAVPAAIVAGVGGISIINKPLAKPTRGNICGR